MDTLQVVVPGGWGSTSLTRRHMAGIATVPPEERGFWRGEADPKTSGENKAKRQRTTLLIYRGGR